MVGRHSGVRQSRASVESSRRKVVCIAILALLVCGLVAIGLFSAQRRGAVAALDLNSFCPRNGPTSIHSVLVDRTDPLTPLQKEALRRDILRWAEAVPKHGAFRVYEVGVGGSLLSPVVAVCNPGDGTDVSNITANPKLLRKRYEQKFLAPVERMLTGMDADQHQRTSPILEAVQAISVRDFGEGAPDGPNTLTVVSDLLEHQPNFSLYRIVPDAGVFVRSPIGKSLHSELRNVEVTIYLVARRDVANRQTDALGKFWIDWITLQGGNLAAFKHLPG